MIVTIHTTNIEMTPAIKSYVEKKVVSMTKFNEKITKITVDVGMLSHHHNKGKIFFAEAIVFLSRKTVRVKKEAEDLYKAIDKVRDHMKTELKEVKDKRAARDRKTLRKIKGYQG